MLNRILLTSLATAIVAQASIAHAAKFIPIAFNRAQGVSAVGDYVVGESYNSSKAAYWTEAGGAVDLGPSSGIANAVSADGSVIVGLHASGSFPAFNATRWTAVDYLPSAITPGVAADVTDDGSVVVGRRDFVVTPGNARGEAFRWTQAGGVVNLGYLPGGETGSSAATAVTPDGLVIVGGSKSSNGDSEAFRWTQAGGMVGLGDLPGGTFSSNAVGVSDDGSVVVGNGRATGLPGETLGVPMAFHWTQANGMVSMGRNTIARGVTGDGSIVVGNLDADAPPGPGVTGASIWKIGGGHHFVQDLLTAQGVDMTGWYLDEANDISPDGRYIVGRALSPKNGFVAYLAVIPEPSQWLMALQVAGIAVAAQRCRASRK